MKKLYTSLLVVGLGISAFGATSTPIETTDKQSIPFPAYAGVKTCVLGTSTGTANVLCTPQGFSSQTPSTGTLTSGIILQVFGSSLTTGFDYLVFKDTNTLGTGINAISTLAVYSQGSQNTPVGGLIFPRFKNGLAVAAPAGIASAGQWTIVYTTDIY